jgi:hypothetical protein
MDAERKYFLLRKRGIYSASAPPTTPLYGGIVPRESAEFAEVRMRNAE